MKVYLGDGVYAEIDEARTELGIKLTTDDGIQITNKIILDWNVLASLGMFVTKYLDFQYGYEFFHNKKIEDKKDENYVCRFPSSNDGLSEGRAKEDSKD